MLERDHDNIRAAMDRAVAIPDASTAIRIGFGDVALLAEARPPHRGEAPARGHRQQPWSRDDPVLRARLMEALGGVGWWMGDLETLERAYTEALGLWREIGDQKEIANALYNHSFTYAVSTDISVPTRRAWAGPRSRRRFGIYREIGDERGEANVLWGIGNYEYFEADGRSRGRIVPGRAGDLPARRRPDDGGVGAPHARQRQGPPGSGRRGRATDRGGAAAVPRKSATWPGSRSRSTTSRRSPSPMTTCRALPACGAPRARCRRPAESSWPTWWTSSTSSTRGRTPGASMDPDELERYAREGRAMSLDETVAYALDMPVSEVPGPHEHAGGPPG